MCYLFARNVFVAFSIGRASSVLQIRKSGRFEEVAECMWNGRVRLLSDLWIGTKPHPAASSRFQCGKRQPNWPIS